MISDNERCLYCQVWRFVHSADSEQ